MLNSILDIVYNHNGLLILIHLALTALLLFSGLERENRIYQRIILAVWLVGTAYLVFFERSPLMDARYNFIPFRDDNLYNIKSNVLIFVPFVPALCGAFRKVSPKAAVISGFLVIIAIELIQLVSHRGICDIDDLLENGLSVLIGTGFYLLMRKLSAPKED